MKKIIKSIKKRKLSSFLIALQVFISMLLLINIACAIQSLFYRDITVPKILKVPPERVVHLKLNYELTTPKMFFDFRDRSLKEAGLEFMGSYRTTGLLKIDELAGNAEFAKLTARHVPLAEPGVVTCLTLEKGVQSLKAIQTVKGRELTNEDFIDSRIIPVLAGYELVERGFMAVGSEFKSREDNKKYKVVGQLAKHSTWFEDSPSGGRLSYLDSMLVVPLNDSAYSYDMVNFNYYCTLNASENIQDSLSKIINIAEKTNVEIKVQTIKEELDISRKKDISNNARWLIFSLFFIVMTSFGTATIMLSNIVSRKEEIGIRMAAGYSIGQLQKLFTGEILFIIFFATLTAIGASIIGYNYSSDKEIDGFYVSPAIALLITLLAFMISIPPAAAAIFKLRKLQPRELIGGRE